MSSKDPIKGPFYYYFGDLLKARSQKYFKRIPKAGGGYKYIYKEHHQGGIGAQEHMMEGAAFKLSFQGQEGHFHIIKAEGDRLIVKHDELHGPDHKGVEMTKAELSALLMTEHKPALEADAEKKRARVDKMKRETPRHIGLKQAERLAQEAEARAGVAPKTPAQDTERPNNFETMPKSSARPAQNAEAITAQLEANEPKLTELTELRSTLKQASKAPPPRRDKRANFDNDLFSSLGPNQKLASEHGFKLVKPTAEQERLIEEQKAIFAAPADAKPKASPALLAIREQYLKAFPDPRTAFKEIFLKGAMLEPYQLKHTQASRADINTEKLSAWLIQEEGRSKKRARVEALEASAAYIDKMREIEIYAAEALENSTTDAQRAEINEIIQQARTKALNYLERLTTGREDRRGRTSGDNIKLFIKEDLNITRKLREARNRHLEESLKEVERQEREIRDQNIELREQKDALEISARAKTPAPEPEAPATLDTERPDNFETMPESENDYTREGVALSRAARLELTRATGAAMRSGDQEQVERLIDRRDRDNAHTSHAPLDEMISQWLSDGDRRELPDGGRTVEQSGRLNDEMSTALAEAVEAGALTAQTAPNGALVYTLPAERAGRVLDTQLLITTKKGAFTFNYADYSAPNASDDYPPSAQAEDLIKEEASIPPPKDQARVSAILDELQTLINKEPSLATDPRIMALLGTPEGQPEPKREGREVTLFVTGIDGLKAEQKAQYRLIEAGDAIASHDPIAFSKRRDYPEGVQERAYHSSKSEQMKVIRNGGAMFNPAYLVNTNPDATNGPPIITPEGHALGGNSRVMSLQRVYAQNPEAQKKYKAELKAQAESFGFSAADVDALKQPMLVRVYDPPSDEQKDLRQLVRAMNESKTAGMEGRTEGRALASKLSENTLKTIKRVLNNAPKDYSFNRFLTKPSKGLNELVGALFKDGIITAESAPKLLRVSDGTLNPQGRDLMQKILVGHVVRNDLVLDNLDYQTYENLTVVLGKLAAHGLSEAQRSALEDAVTIYNEATSKEKLKARDSLADRNEAMRFLLEDEQEMFTGASATGLDVQAIKDRVLTNPLARGFLQMMTLAPSSRKLDAAFDLFIELTEKKEQVDMFAAGPMDFEPAINQIIKELASKEKLDIQPYGMKKSIRARRGGFFSQLTARGF